ncbi:pteridine reductase [Gammaproteobacteria bacterium]|jgi:pteridine reductase|uniref:Pteridine reductase n=1 Tax=SAR86 cluster bacterium TaxID=2030880 RepID=A0A520MU40_9GAMM|nr:pteridine reductase [Gammaproteobacteria bacterium]MDC0901932.1 pteridine reductase [Gammaproteobacteria bacterium]MDC1110729.1 pteridine reductase [Gammaproteobacteria bacterium]MDC1131386.1 pteridine reductase [Gammaproteobacteria bacterium]RZO24742.1 MAG: pteridine reductase [SAR86 cluster bacterium]|tara:strand:- start:1281 stop:2006 length:726 start_codon:yes stop_codon:yes gene_type:complete
MKKRILITGAAKRIGKEMALSFFNKGWDIVIHYNSSKEEAEALADQMNSERNNSAMLVQANLDNANEVEMLVEKILSKNGSIDALINNASTFYPTPIGTFSEENWNALMGSNLKAPLFLIQSFYKELEKNKGFIINVTDINVDRALVNHSIYLAAKSGLQTLTKSLAKELAPNIRVNAIAPGAILEPPNTDWTAEQKNNIINAVPMRRMGTEKDIVDAAIYLSEAEYVTGQILNIDGGKSL